METRKILIVEDEQDVLKLEKKILAAEGYNVDAAACAEEALILLEENFYELIIVDVMMPGMSGFELSEIIRADPTFAKKYENTPVLFVTAKSEPKDMTRVYSSGGVAYLSKPFSRFSFVTAVKTLTNITQPVLA
ncbi:MAG: response regulator [Myxococcota bacterium]